MPPPPIITPPLPTTTGVEDCVPPPPFIPADTVWVKDDAMVNAGEVDGWPLGVPAPRTVPEREGLGEEV